MPGHVIAIAYYTLREMTRRKLLYFIVGGGAVLVVALGILFSVIRANAPGGSVPTQDFSGFVLIQMNGVVSFFAWVASIAIAVTLINHDLESGSVVSIFSKPVSRLSYALGKLLAAHGRETRPSCPSVYVIGAPASAAAAASAG